MSRKRVAVIGAGAAGLTAIKSCLEEDLDVVCYERMSSLGGIWHFDAQDTTRTSVMKCTLMNTNKELSAFSDFSVPADYPLFMPQDVAMKYLDSYAERFKLKQRIKFSHEVEAVKELEDGSWMVTVMDTEGVIREEWFDAVLVCSGHHNHPKIPDIPGIQSFKRTLIHSAHYRTNEQFKDKSVLVIGLGSSASDVCADLSSVAKNVFLSRRRGAWITRRTAEGGKPYDSIFLRRFENFFMKLIPNWLLKRIAEKRMRSHCDPSRFGIEPDYSPFAHELLISDTIVNQLISQKVQLRGDIERVTETEVILKSSEVLQIDAIVLCTGFDYKFPMIKDDILLRNIIERTNHQIGLFKNMFAFNIRKPNSMAFIGLVQTAGPIWPTVELQGRFAAKVIKGTRELPVIEKMQEDVVRTQQGTLEQFLMAQKGLTCLFLPWIDYNDSIANLLGCAPKLVKYFVTDPILYIQLLFGPSVPPQYRLEGESKCPNARKNILTVDDRIAESFKH